VLAHHTYTPCSTLLVAEEQQLQHALNAAEAQQAQLKARVGELEQELAQQRQQHTSGVEGLQGLCLGIQGSPRTDMIVLTLYPTKLLQTGTVHA
jgi:hypothetical protein